MKSIDFSRNNLDGALSPYLRQHAGNPVHWQQWSAEVLDHARSTGKILFVSVGYSTCHWCHVMAAGAFSDPACADYLNRHFLSVKVDREERPDLDRFMMSFLTETTGSGGWPLNVFLSPDLEPFFAMTFAAEGPRYGSPGFGEILVRVKEFYDGNRHRLSSFDPGFGEPRETADFEAVESILLQRFDAEQGGLGTGQKFPPHSTLLFGLYRAAEGGNGTRLGPFVEKTLDAVCSGGLHDHLQGGYFRYCVDRAWTIPHFEKMLYDQALLLWLFSLAARLYGRRRYREAAEGILTCLRDTFLEEGLFCSGHDADTGHREGETYVWTAGELRRVLTPEEYEAFAESFYLPEEGNFEGKIHLLRKPRDAEHGESSAAAAPAARKLLAERKKRPQPFLDRKKLTAWNALAGIGLLQMHRHLGSTEALDLALGLREALVSRHLLPGGETVRGTLDDERIGGWYLEDHAALLYFLTMACEEDGKYPDLIITLAERLEEFRENGRWVSSRREDFRPVYAEPYDLPVPAESTLAELALARAAMLTGKEFGEIRPGLPGAQDFRSFAALETGGAAYLVHSPEPLPWTLLPPHTVRIRDGETFYCRKGECVKGPPPESGGP